MAKERVLPALVGPTRVPVALSAPFAFGTDGTELLRARLWCVTIRSWGAADRVFNLTVRSVKEDGTSQLSIRSIVPTTDTIATPGILALEAGALQTISLAWGGGSLSTWGGLVYAIVDVVRGTIAGAQTIVGTLMAGYLDAGLALTWPGSSMRGPMEGPGYLNRFPGVGVAGAEVLRAGLPGAVWRIREIHAEYHSDATVANRRPNVRFFLPSSGGALWPNGAEIPASQTVFSSWAPGAALGVGRSNSVTIGPIPDNVIMRNGDTVRTVTNGMQAGDIYNAFDLLVEQWIEPLL